MRPDVGSREAQGYESALHQLGRELRPTLRALDHAAGDPWGLDGHAEELAALQYALHVASERVLELPPQAGVEDAHEELIAALAIAREETAGVAAALEELGSVYAAGLVWEWRVALFGVRIALRQTDGESDISDRPQELRSAYAPVALLAVGVAGVLGGALAELWPLWAAGLVLVAVSALVSHRP